VEYLGGVVAVVGVYKVLPFAQGKVAFNNPIRDALFFESLADGFMGKLVRICLEMFGVTGEKQIPRSFNQIVRPLHEIECEAVRLWNRVVVETTVLDGGNILIQVLLDAESLRGDVFQVVFERCEHPYTLFQSVHAPVLLDRDSGSAELEALQNRQLVRPH